MATGNRANDFRMSLHGLPYDQTVAAQPPIKITTASAKPNGKVPSLSNGDSHAAALARASDKTAIPPVPPLPAYLHDTSGDFKFSKHDSFGFFAEGGKAMNETEPRASEISAVPQIRVEDDADTLAATNGIEKRGIEANGKVSGRSSVQKKDRTTSKKDLQQQLDATASTFQGLTLDLPSSALGDDLQAKKMQFSHRGSMFIDGRKVGNNSKGLLTADPSIRANSLQVRPNVHRIPTSSSVPEREPPRLMSTDEEALSEKVRSFYATGSDIDADAHSSVASKINQRWQDTMANERNSVLTSSRRTSAADTGPAPHSPSLRDFDSSAIVREELELAGGLEDWQDVDNADVDRYGFIVRPDLSHGNEELKVKRSPTTSGHGLQRVSTSLQLASEAPRRKHTIRKPPSSAHGERRMPSRKGSDVSSKSAGAPQRPTSARSANVHRHTTLRAASNRFPGNRDRRLMDEAADMLTLPRSLSASSQVLTRTTTNNSDHSTASQTVASKMTSPAARKKELEREEKWRKMAKPVSTSPSIATTAAKSGLKNFKSIGNTLLFSFPPLDDTKLVSRTWKGIPDSWRSQAWHYFLSVSAAKLPTSIPDGQLISLFYQYQEQNSPDDVQIDIDVPRTISSHIMFRRRYRGGQRLLFRVLHAMSLHAPDTGYVQGMAALAATLLAYYEEEKAFVMLVRLWEVRGLGRLYEAGFGGLMEALDRFETAWLGDGDVGKKLNSVNIVPTAYGTKWYLTLFNYSIPFPAQLRVWDVFMLLGDDPQSLSTKQPTSTAPVSTSSPLSGHVPLGSSLDVLHATSAALIDGMRDILLESDFENAMKVLTSWIPIRDEDLFMRVAKAEWKMHRKESSLSAG